ncbi:polysaccharide biosynthesis protein [Sphingomonas sp. Leaf412]|nr:polysaccharide biosynthesis protein [Sphingomonas sp. Leaf412]
MADKAAMKEIVGDRLGRDWVVPMLWSGTALPDRPVGRGPMVVKARHGCNQNAFVHDDAGWRRAGRRAVRWVGVPYGRWLDEWLYTLIPRGILIEPFIGVDGALPVDYKFYVFGGHVTHVQVHLDRGGRHRWTVHDRKWIPMVRDAPVVTRPTALDAMIAAAEEMGRGFDFVRVDFYQPAARPLFGEMCFYPGSGLDPFDPPWLDAEMGRLWMAAARRRAAGRDGARDRVAA